MENTNSKWPRKTKDLAIDLHTELTITNTNWHQFKSDPERRAAELLSGAMVQILSDGNKSDIAALINQSLRWINGEAKDPGCPRH